MKNWWINNSWRFWAWQWAFGDEDSAFTVWQEYRHMLNPDDERSLVEMIIEEYEADVRRDVFGNPVIQVVWWIQQIGRNLRSLTKIEPPKWVALPNSNLLSDSIYPVRQNQR